jgi:drug/metabolite transporter (DMT)-like permease
MDNRRIMAIIILIPFSILSGYAIAQVGYFGIIDYHRYSPAGWQVLADLAIALILTLSWLIPEARKDNRSPWLWVLATVLMGSIGPLLYLVTARTPFKQES